MFRSEGFIPRLFLNRFSQNGRHPEWFALLLAAMVTAAVWTAAWGITLFVTQSQHRPEDRFAPLAIFLLILTFFGDSTLWFHLVYVFRHRFGRDAPAVERHVEIWGGLIVSLVILLAKIGWLIIKYVGLPLIPLGIAGDVLPQIPVIGTALEYLALFAIMLYPFAAVAVYLVRRRGAAPVVSDADSSDQR